MNKLSISNHKKNKRFMEPFLPGWPKDVLEDFTLVKKLGSGSYSTVWEAIHKKSGAKVAIKKEDDIFLDLTDCKRVLREIRLLKAMNHKNVIKLLDLRAHPNLSQGTICLILEIADRDLKTIVRSPTSWLPLEQIKVGFYDILKGLKYMHSAAVIHRDIKPGNVLVLQDKKLFICDFGLARSIAKHKGPHAYNKKKLSEKKKDPPMQLEKMSSKELMSKEEEDKAMELELPPLETQLTSYVVTRWYRAPEIILSQSDYGLGIDIWAAGCVFAELLSILDTYGKYGTDRRILFPGSSCYPFSPVKGERAKSGISVLATDQLNVIFDVIGTPTEEECSFITDPEKLKVLREKSKKTRKDFSEVYPSASKEAVDLLSKMLIFNPFTRPSISQCLDHPFFSDIRKPETETVAPMPVDLGFDDEGDLDKVTLTKHFNEDLAYYAELRKSGKINYKA